ncbi:MAG: glycoside hydrolase family 130 protein [Terrimicrobiaceae bacterium]
MIAVQRQNLTLRPDASRVLVRPFLPSDPARTLRILARIFALDEDEAKALLDSVLREFGGRHQKIQSIFLERYAAVEDKVPTDRPLSETRKLLIGSFFTSEYSLESAALFNPSIVADPDQSDVSEGSLRIILSLRATGEGHISSITFRSGLLGPDGQVSITPPSRFVTEPRAVPNAHFDKALFRQKLAEMGQEHPAAQATLEMLPEEFTFEELKAAASQQRKRTWNPEAQLAVQRLIVLARSNYSVAFDPSETISQRVIFPYGPTETNGIEDARLTRFVCEDGSVVFYATYTAYDGRAVLPQMLETRDFVRFSVSTLNGPAVQNKGMALFPRKVRGLYCMLSRQDNENIHLMFSNHPHFWHESEVIIRPREPWEFVQMGNCGPPIETERGWLVLTHGVGPMRRYCIGAVLLDLDDPSRLIGRLREPLIEPETDEREGYVPNVVYTCGALVHNGRLLIPYAVSDSATSFASVGLADLLGAMVPVGR